MRDSANTSQGSGSVWLGDAAEFYDRWPAPTCVIADGPYGVSGFPGDPPTVDGLADWYRRHVNAWSERALPSTTLWFWGTELSWATVHQVLVEHGWQYRAFHVWDKGIAHVAGNVNGSTIRRFPAVTECCVQYVKKVTVPSEDGRQLTLQQWLRHEWRRAGLPFTAANAACGVRNAATRKYLTGDHRWYFPPPDVMEKLVRFANEHGNPEGRPYFAVNGSPVTADRWRLMRAKWHHEHGVSNVWEHPAVRGEERLKDTDGRVVHTNQKPLALMRRIVAACTDEGDVVWEPFGGLCTGTLAAAGLGRHGYAAEISPDVCRAAQERLSRAAADRAPARQQTAGGG